MAKLGKDDIFRAVSLKEHGVNNKDIAAAIGVAPQTFSTWINHPANCLQRELSEALKNAEARAKDAMLSAIMRAALEDRTWQAAAWWLERKYPAEFGRAGRLEAMLVGKAESDGIEDDPLSASVLAELAVKMEAGK